MRGEPLIGRRAKAGMARVWWHVKLYDHRYNTSHLSILEVYTIKLATIQIHVYLNMIFFGMKLYVKFLCRHVSQIPPGPLFEAHIFVS